MASGDDKAASQAGHMAAPTSNADAHLTLANGEPSTHGAKLTFQLCSDMECESNVGLGNSRGTRTRFAKWDLGPGRGLGEKER
jgi:hypothetical protein